MLEDLNSSLGESRKNIEDYTAILDDLRIEQNNIDDILYYLRSNLDKIDQQVFDTVSEEVIDRGKRVFLENAREAVIATREYDYPPFRERLFSVVEDSGLISIKKIDSGGRVNIHMNTVAGNLDDYIEGVKFARKQLNVGRTPPETASKIWAEKIYGVDREGKKVTKKYKGRYKKHGKGTKDITERYKGKYKKTIELRLSKLSSIAPFWPIIEYGTEMFPDEGGYAYPRFEATGFVEKTRIQLQNLFDGLYTRKYQDELHYYTERINDLSKRRKDLDSQIRNINQIIEDMLSSVSSRHSREVNRFQVAVDLVSDYVYNVRGIKKEIEQHYIELAASRIESGDLTRTSLGQGESIRIVELERQFRELLDRYISGEE